MVNSPTSSLVRIVQTKLKISASGIIGSQVPQMSKSYSKFKRSLTPRSTETYSLHELSHTPFRHHGIIPPVHFANLPNFAVGICASHHSQVTREGNGMVITQRKLFSALIHEVEYKLESSPYLSVKTSLRSKTGVSRHEPPKLVKQVLTIFSICSRRNISPGP